MRHSAFLRSLRIMALAWAASMLAGCTANILERTSPNPNGYPDQVTAVTSAHQRDDGSVVVCVIGKPGAIPAFTLAGGSPDEAFSLILPADTTGRLTIDRAHASLPRYLPGVADAAGACADRAPPGTPLPVHAVTNGDLGYPEHERLTNIPDAALEDLFDSRAGPPAIYVHTWSPADYREIIYVAPEARFDGARAVFMEPGRRPAQGNPAYIAALPVAVVVDVLMAPVYLYYITELSSVH